MNEDQHRPVTPEPIVGIRGKGMLKCIGGSLGAVALFAAITLSGLVNLPVVGKYFLLIPAAALAVGIVGALELWTGEPLAVWSARWESLPTTTRRLITALVLVLAVGAVALISMWHWDK